jgi:hypothetical protein
VVGNHAGNGGGLYSTGELVVEDSQISDNVVPSERGLIRHGGGMYLSGSAKVIRSWIMGNTASYGGGIFKNPDASLEISGSFIAYNTAGTSGGGVLNNRGPFILESTTITGNQGVGLSNNRGNVTVTNVTISGNSGTGVENRGVSGDSGALVIVHATIAGNGGGVLTDGASQVTLRASILDGNRTNCTGILGEPGGAVGVIQSDGANISSDSTCRFSAAGDRNGTSGRLGPLGDNGGGSPTHALAPDSPALDAAGACGLPTDQRGLARPQVGIPGGAPACDSGSFELQ